jgi:hypothetical protein
MRRWAWSSGGRSGNTSATPSCWVVRSSLVAAVCGLAGGCLEDYKLPYNTGSLGGQVVLSGGVRGATVIVDQLNVHTGEVYQRVGTAITDADGRWVIPETREANSLFRLVSRGGEFDDLATGATIQLDDTDELHSFLWFPIVDQRTDALISPVGHLIAMRAWSKLAILGDMKAAVEDATDHVSRHFGQTEWGLVKLHDLATPATSPTKPVRAALVHAALSFLVSDIGAAAGASPQQLNVYTLVRQWTADLVRMHDADPAVWDGNDGNDRTFGSGLQLGVCEPIDPACATPPAGCNIGHCRAPCDLYAGTPRAALAGALTKVIRDDRVNRTGLRIEDTLAIARAMSENTDSDLFGTACTENLDRTPPSVRWDEAASPAADAVVRGTITFKATGIDDVDLQPRTEIVGYVDQDGDPSNSVAIASIDTAGLSDGGFTVTARAVDLAGNSSTAERRVIVDNTPPQLSLSPPGFFVDGPTWWTTSASPTLTGTVLDAHPATVQATIGATQVPGTLSGGSWSVTLPDGAIDLAGANVTIRVTDRAGNVTELTQRLRRDATPPGLSFQTSTVNDEAPEVPTFTAGNANQALNHIPVHMHGGPTINLDVDGSCPTVTKYSYLLGELPPEYGLEVDSLGNQRRNPIRYQLVTADDGVGIAPGSTQYRVGRRAGATTTWILDWTSTGTGTPIAPGTTQYGVGIFSNQVAGLATTEGTYEVELRASDRLARTTTVARCFDLKLKAPPLEFLPASAPIPLHTYQLDALSLSSGPPFDLVAARLLNDNATGASLIDQPLFNGTASTVYLTVTVTKPVTVTATQSFVIRNLTSISSVSSGGDCYTGPDDDWTGACDPPAAFPGGEYTSPLVTVTQPVNIPAKLYEVDGAGVPTTEIPCLAPCSAGDSVFRFAVPPRVAGGPARSFVIMTMIGQVTTLWPKDGNQPAVAPFFDSSVNGVRYTGKQQFSSSGCTKLNPSLTKCVERTSRTQYRALIRARLELSNHAITSYSTAVTLQITPIEATLPKTRDQALGWETLEGALP